MNFFQNMQIHFHTYNQTPSSPERQRRNRRHEVPSRALSSSPPPSLHSTNGSANTTQRMNSSSRINRDHVGTTSTLTQSEDRGGGGYSNSFSSLILSMIQNELNNVIDSSSSSSSSSTASSSVAAATTAIPNLSDIFFLTEIPISYNIPSSTSSSMLQRLSSGINLNDMNRCTELFVVDNELLNGDIVCSICQNAFLESNIVRKINQCQHVFHTSCIDRWLSNNTTCPVCRSNVLIVTNDTVV